ncbi:MAG: PilZ domain-containing protein [Candidatus Omnitrophica bacterium]|nr:PilZ domain-containing protein [Candidatus Omnitrophota bacterium]
MQTQIERREYPRTNIELPVALGSGISCKTSDISESGIGFVSQKPIPLNVTRAKLIISEAVSIECDIDVVWNTKCTENNEYKYGACLKDIKPEDTALLRNTLIDVTIDKFAKTITDDSARSRFERFFLTEVDEYISKVIDITRRLKYSGISKDLANEEFFKCTDEVLEKAEDLESSVKQKRELKQAKHFFRTIISHWIYKGKIVKRAFDKPRGYPGDYGSIEQIYDNKPLSENIGYHSDAYFLANEYAVAVRNRKERIKDIISEFIDKSNLSSFKVLNVACGSCRELREMFKDKTSISKKVILNLLDHDAEALEFSKKTLPKIDGLELNFIKEDIMKLSKNSPFAEKLKGQDLIYSLGLCDYLPDRVLKKLICFCLSALSVKGSLVLTHKDINNSRPIAPDWFCDWKFYPRTEEEFTNLIFSAKDGVFIKNVAREASNKILFVIAQNKYGV